MPQPQPKPLIYNGETYNFLSKGGFNDVYINENRTHVLKVYQNIGQQRTVANRNQRVWDACKRPEIGAAEVVTCELAGKQITAMKVPFLPYKIADVICYDARKQQEEEVITKAIEEEVITKVITAVRKESIRIFLSTGRIIADGHLYNFLYDEQTDTAHCIDHDLAHLVTLTELSTNRNTFSNEPQHKEDFTSHLEHIPDMGEVHPDETGIGRALNAMDTTDIGKQLNEIFKSGILNFDDIREKLIDKMSDVMSKTIKYEAGDYTSEEIGDFAKALEDVIRYAEVNPLFAVQSDIRAYVNLRLGSDTTLQGVEDKATKDWKGQYNKEDKLVSLKKLLQALLKCNPTNLESLKDFKAQITTTRNKNIVLEKSGVLGLVHQATKRHPGGELGKLLDQCEEDVNKIIQDLENKNKPTPTA